MQLARTGVSSEKRLSFVSPDFISKARVFSAEVVGSQQPSKAAVPLARNEAPTSTLSSAARFISLNNSIVTAQRGSTASLPCEVLSLGDGVVSHLPASYSPRARVCPPFDSMTERLLSAVNRRT